MSNHLSHLPTWISEGASGCVLAIHVQPGAKGMAVVGEHGGALKIRIDAPPVDGRANKALLAFLAEKLATPKHQLELLSGESSRQKRVLVRAMTAATVMALLTSAAPK